MVDNITAPGAGSVLAFDDVSGVLYARTKISIGADGAAADMHAGNPLPIYTPSGIITVAAQFTRPADTAAYASGDLVSTSTSAAVPLDMANAVRAAGSAIRIERIRLRKTTATLANASFRVHLFRTLPTLSVNDNGAFNASGVLAVSDIAGYVGSVDIVMDRAGAVGASGRATASAGMTTEPSAGTSLYVLIEALAAYAPGTGEVFHVTLEGAWA